MGGAKRRAPLSRDAMSLTPRASACGVRSFFVMWVWLGFLFYLTGYSAALDGLQMPTTHPPEARALRWDAQYFLRPYRAQNARAPLSRDAMSLAPRAGACGVRSFFV
ncbi:MAG: hypothetical protein DHS20C08_10360 [Rhodomicrobium sp.]|nr:MAG: hypothetical protein DHS20C08_10360 [Rhodomicrobium sp.]